MVNEALKRETKNLGERKANFLRRAFQKKRSERKEKTDERTAKIKQNCQSKISLQCQLWLKNENKKERADACQWFYQTRNIQN